MCLFLKSVFLPSAADFLRKMSCQTMGNKSCFSLYYSRPNLTRSNHFIVYVLLTPGPLQMSLELILLQHLVCGLNFNSDTKQSTNLSSSTSKWYLKINRIWHLLRTLIALFQQICYLVQVFSTSAQSASQCGLINPTTSQLLPGSIRPAVSLVSDTSPRRWINR